MYLPSESHVSRPVVLSRKALGVRHHTRGIECLRSSSAIANFGLFFVDLVTKAVEKTGATGPCALGNGPENHL
jgi:hypothetical protein